MERAGSEILLAAGTPSAEAFKRLYYSHRASPLPEILSGRRVELLARLGRTPKGLKALAEETDISSDTVYYPCRAKPTSTPSTTSSGRS